MNKILFYTKNGDVCHHENYTEKEAIETLKQQGYKTYYKGRKFGKNGIPVIVGIDENNLIGIKERRKNGLYNARKINL